MRLQIPIVKGQHGKTNRLRSVDSVAGPELYYISKVWLNTLRAGWDATTWLGAYVPLA